MNLIPTKKKKNPKQQNAKPKKQNPFAFNAHPQNTNQIKHLEQTKEGNNKGEVKVLGLEAMIVEEHSER